MNRVHLWPLMAQPANAQRAAGDEPMAPNRVSVATQRLTERFLADVVKVDWAEVHLEADKIAPAVSPDVEDRMRRLLGDPGTCPHGNPIPGSINAPDHSDAVRLSDASGSVTVLRIDEAIEDDLSAMRLLATTGLVPGRNVRVGRRSRAEIEVGTTRADTWVPVRIAQHTYVRQDAVDS